MTRFPISGKFPIPRDRFTPSSVEKLLHSFDPNVAKLARVALETGGSVSVLLQDHNGVTVLGATVLPTPERKPAPKKEGSRRR